MTIPNKKGFLRTSDLAREVGIHPNTVRLYEKWGLLQPVPRSPNGYRQFSQAHLDQIRLVRMAFSATVIGGEVRDQALAMIRVSAAGDSTKALKHALAFRQAVEAEQAQADEAIRSLERWAGGGISEKRARVLRISETARLLDTGIDALRGWERNGLIVVPRNPANGYREYGPEEIGRLRVIRMLIRSGYGIMSILRMLTRLDSGVAEDLRSLLDTPSPEEDILYASNQWLTTLEQARSAADRSVSLAEEMLRKA